MRRRARIGRERMTISCGVHTHVTAGRQGRGRQQAFRAPPRARPHAQGARAAPFSRARPGHAARAARRLLRCRAGRVLRHRRAQRLGQVDAAEVHGGDLRDRWRRDLHQRPPVDVHRARRRLQPRPAGARQRGPQRDDARALAARGRPALRRGHRLRRARGLRRPEAQELLVGHGGSPRVLGDDPGRRRHPAHRRGARGRRRRLPAEVLRRVRADPRAGAHGAARHPRHGSGAALLRPGDAAGERPHRRAGRSRARRHPLPRAELLRSGARGKRARA